MASRVGSAALVAALLTSSLAGGVPSAAAGGGDTLGASLAAEPRAATQSAAADGALQSGGTAWQGQALRFDAAGVLDRDGTVEVWRVTEDGQLNRQVGSFTVGQDGTHVLDTAGLEGRYVLRYGEQPVYVDEGRAYLSSPPGGSPVTVESSAFRVARQRLSFSWSDPTAYPGQRVTLTVESNRASSTAAVSAEGLTYEELEAVFPQSALANDHDARASRDVLLLSLSRTTTLDLNTTPMQPGDGGLLIDVVDTSAREHAGLDVLQPAADRRFRSIEHREQVGDVVEAELACGQCFVVLGGPGQGFLDVVEVRDANGDGSVTLRMNTRYIGMDTSASGYPAGVRAYTSPRDEVTRYLSGATLESVRDDLNYGTTTLNELRKQQGLAAGGRDQPLGPGQYRLTIAASDYVIDRSAYGDIPPLGAELVVKDETDVATVTLAPRSLDSAGALSLPGGSGYAVTVEALRAVRGDRKRIAVGDRLVFRFDVSGVFGYLHAHGASFDRVVDADAEGVDLTLERVSGAADQSLDIDRLDSELVVDEDGDALYLVVRTDRSGPQSVEAGTYRARLTLDGVGAKYESYSTRRAHEGYPYLAPGRTESVAATVTLAEPAAGIDPPDGGSTAYLTPEGVFEVGGTTSLAPGTTLTVVTTSVEFAWETRATATVRPNGTWSVGADLAEAPGERFEVAVYAGQRPLDARTVTVRPAPEREAQDEEPSERNGGDGSEEGGAVSEGEADNEGMTVAGYAIPGLDALSELAVPLGGGVGALAVVWGAWRFVIRRLIL